MESFLAYHRNAVTPATADDHPGRPTFPEPILEALPRFAGEPMPFLGLHGDAVLVHA